MREFKVGDRVKFVSNPHRYVVGSANPLVGTSWECGGTITKVYTAGKYNEVLWDTGRSNSYKPGCLDFEFTPAKLPEDLFVI